MRGRSGGLFFGGGGRRGERAHEEHKLPALVFGEAFFEGGHGLSAFTDSEEEFAVGDGRVVRPVGKIRGMRIVQMSFRTVAFAGIAMALDAVVEV